MDRIRNQLDDPYYRLLDVGSSHARLADLIRPMPNNRKSRHSGLPIALISRLADLVVQSVLPIAIHRLLHRFYSLARGGSFPAAVHCTWHTRRASTF